MKRIRIAAVAAAAVAGASAAAGTPSPMLTWAGCAGALVAKTMLAEDETQAPRLQILARRALAEAKRADNPEKLTDSQIDGLAMSTARKYLADAKSGTDQRARLDAVADGCEGMVAKLPS